METAYRTDAAHHPDPLPGTRPLRPRNRPRNPRRGPDLSPGLSQRRTARGVADDARTPRRNPLPARLDRQRPDAGRQGRAVGPARLRHRHSGRRAGAGPRGDAPFGELPLRGRVGRRPRGRRSGGEVAGFATACSITSRPGVPPTAGRPNARELAATGVLALDLVEVSAKVRTGGPVDDPEDCALPHWAGVVPLQPGGRNPGAGRRPRPGHRGAAVPHSPSVDLLRDSACRRNIDVRAATAGSGRPASRARGLRCACPSPASAPAGRRGRRPIPTRCPPAPHRSPGCCA